MTRPSLTAAGTRGLPHRSSRAVLRGVSFIAALVCCSAAAAEPHPAYIRRTAADCTLGNDFLELQLAVTPSRVVAKGLVNKLTGQTVALDGDNFSLGREGGAPLTAADFALKDVREEPLPQGGKRVVLQLAGDPQAATLDVRYELGDRDFFLRRQLVLQTQRPLPLRRVDVWSVRAAGECTHQGFGEPVFLGDTFWGVEFPGGHNAGTGGVVTLSHYPGRTVTDRFASKSAVLGVAPRGGVARQFQRYVKTYQATPEATRLFVNYNTWWTLMPPNEKNCRELVDLFRRKLFDVHGQSFDTFTIDEGWDDKNSLWKLRADRFPKGFEPLTEPLRAMHAAHGLWLSPSSGYNHAPWGATAGYEHNSNAWFLCQSGPKYRQDIVRVVTELADKYQMAFFKFDGFCAGCEAPGHGHLPGPYAKEANIDAFIELLQAVRQGRPNVFLDPTCGIWLSPWWLAYTDALWGEVSGDYPDIIVPAPIVRDSATTTRDAAFRKRCQEHPGFPPAAIEHLGIIVITPEKWEDNAMIVLGRGCRLLTLYVNPACFVKGDRDWAFLASILKWVRHHAGTLDNTELILGDPLGREAYGYAHFANARSPKTGQAPGVHVPEPVPFSGIVALRNPFIEPQTVKVKLDESAGLSRPAAGGGDANSAALTARVVYPYHTALPGVFRHGDAFECALEGYETKVIQFAPPGGPAWPTGVRYVETERTANRVQAEVFGAPGQTLTFAPASPASGISQLVFAGQPVAMGGGQPATAATRFAGTPVLASVQNAKLAPCAPDGRWRIDGACDVQVPPQSRATMHILCDPKTGRAAAMECAARVDGQAAKVRAVRAPVPPQQAHGPHPWTWFEFDVPSGNHSVTIAVNTAQPDGDFFRGEVGWWLWLEHPLSRATLAVDYQQPVPPAEPLPLPIGSETRRQILTIQPARLLRTGSRWPKTDRPTVYLDEVAPDESQQDWGHLERNRSVWQKEMVIAGQAQRRGLGTHANSRIVYELSGGRFTKFHAVVGRDGHSQDGKLSFQVWLDGQRRFDSGPLTQATAGQTVEVDLRGAAVMELRTLDGGDGISGDHGNWADAQLLR